MLDKLDVTSILAVIIVLGGGTAIALGHGDNPVFTHGIELVLGFYFGRTAAKGGL